MPVLDKIGRFLEAISKGPYKKDQESNLPSGGHTGYHPEVPKKKKRDMSEDPQPVLDQNGQQPGVQQGPVQNGQMYGQQGFDPNAYGQQQNPGLYTQQQSGQYVQQPVGNFYTQPGYPGTQNPSGYPGSSVFQSPSGQASGPVPGYIGHPGTQVQQPQQNSQAMGEMHYFPGNYVDNEGNAYSHVERLAQPLSTASCFRLIEYMRNGETIIVNTESIADERENNHCLDILYGAAFSMGYHFTKISNLRIYLISPRSVNVIPYGPIKQLSDEDLLRRYPGSIPNPTAQTGPRGFDFDRLDREMDMGPQRRYS